MLLTVFVAHSSDLHHLTWLLPLVSVLPCPTSTSWKLMKLSNFGTSRPPLLGRPARPRLLRLGPPARPLHPRARLPLLQTLAAFLCLPDRPVRPACQRLVHKPVPTILFAILLSREQCALRRLARPSTILPLLFTPLSSRKYLLQSMFPPALNTFRLRHSLRPRFTRLPTEHPALPLTLAHRPCRINLRCPVAFLQAPRPLLTRSLVVTGLVGPTVLLLLLRSGVMLAGTR